MHSAWKRSSLSERARPSGWSPEPTERRESARFKMSHPWPSTNCKPTLLGPRSCFAEPRNKGTASQPSFSQLHILLLADLLAGNRHALSDNFYRNGGKNGGEHGAE